jgi:hypothetical protein
LGAAVKFEKWLSRLESFPWWDSPTDWAANAYEGSWFIKAPDADGSFLVATKYDVYEVSPPLTYSIDDSVYEREWWKKQGQSVPIEALGKWQFLYGLRGLHLPSTNSIKPQEIWVALQGGWSAAVPAPNESDLNSWNPGQQLVEPQDFRGYLARTIGLTEQDLYVFSCLLDSYNLGFAITPTHGRIDTYEMSDYEVATASPEIAVLGRSPSSNLRIVGVGFTSYSFGVSGSGGSHTLDDRWYNETVRAINRVISTPEDLFVSISMATRWTSDPKWLSGFVSQPLKNLQAYLTSQSAIENFQVLNEAGYGVALIPLGGRTIWAP